MTTERPYQVRIFLKQEFAEAVNNYPRPKEKDAHFDLREALPEAAKPLKDILEKHGAGIDHNQFEEFSSFVGWMDANFDKMRFADEDKKQQMQRLVTLTKGSLADAEKCSYFKREFTLSMGGKSQFSGSEADALIADLNKLGDDKIITSGMGFVPGKSYAADPVRKSYVPGRHPGT